MKRKEAAPWILTGLMAALAGPVAAMECREAMAQVDTFGRLPFFAEVEALPEWAVYSSADGECIVEPEGAQYCGPGGYVIDKMLPAGTATPWPWGLKPDDGPKEAAKALAKLLPGEGDMNVREGGPTYNLDIPGCAAWIEVTFEADERGIKAVSLNAQP